MQTESALEAQGEACAGAPTGLRRLTPSLLQVDRSRRGFRRPAGRRDRARARCWPPSRPQRPVWGSRPAWCMRSTGCSRFTQPQDWGEGRAADRLAVSRRLQQDALGLVGIAGQDASTAQLIEAGLVTMKDSPNGKRYGKRDIRKGRIVEAYGFDLSPLVARHAEFRRLAEPRQGRNAIEMGRLRRRATIARNGITQILETAAEYGFTGEEWTQPRSARAGSSRSPSDGRTARGNGAWRREPGTAAACGPRTPGKSARRGSSGRLRNQ